MNAKPQLPAGPQRRFHMASVALLVSLTIQPLLAETTFDDVEKFTWSGNTGCVSFRHDRPSSPAGIIFGGAFLSGYAYSDNTGWIHFGNLTTADAISDNGVSDLAEYLADTVEQSRARSTAFNAINAKSVNLSFGESLSNNQFHRGIVADMVTNSRGTSAGGHGISADTVMNSHGISSGEHGFDSCGIHGVTVIGSTGLATDMAGANQGIRGDRMVQSSFGESKSTHMGANGIHAISGMVESSDGRANGGSGIYAPHVNSSRGSSTGKNGINSSGIRSMGGVVIGSLGFAGTDGGHGISARLVKSSRGGVSNDGLNGIDATVVVDSVGTGTPLINQYGIRADRANSSEASGGEDISTKYNMP